jgi:hypothetical protein
MKVNQLITELTRPGTRLLADERLRAAGYRRIGNGGYGAVYEKPGANFVLKVFASHDTAYLDFVALSRTHTDNPHFPKFIGNVVKVTPAYSAVRMEKLSSCKQMIEPVYNLVKKYLLFAQEKRSHDAHMAADYIQRLLKKELRNEYPELLNACELIIKNLLRKYQVDVKPKNFMMRGSTFVIIDPVANHPEMDKMPHERLPRVRRGK